MFVASSSSKALHACKSYTMLRSTSKDRKLFWNVFVRNRYLGADVCRKSGSKISVFQPVQHEAPGRFLYLNTSVLIKGGIGLLIDYYYYYWITILLQIKTYIKKLAPHNFKALCFFFSPEKYCFDWLKGLWDRLFPSEERNRRLFSILYMCKKISWI